MGLYTYVFHTGLLRSKIKMKKRKRRGRERSGRKRERRKERWRRRKGERRKRQRKEEEKEEAGGGCRLTINSQPSRETHSAQGFRLGKMILPRARPPSLTFPVPGSPFLCAIVGGVHQQLSLCYAVSKD